MARVLILGDERKGATISEVRAFEEWLKGEVDSVTVILDREAPLHEVEADLVCVFGGDGSILSAARRMRDNQLPTLGINVGRLGFLTACGPERARVATAKALGGELHEERRSMLSAQVIHADGTSTESVLALNDGVVTRSSTAGIVQLTAFRGGQELAHYAGDGLIVSTPTGSTAYSLAAGGPVLAPDLDVVVLTPLASHTLALRPLVVPIADGLDLRVESDGASAVLDGQVPTRVSEGDRVCLRPAQVKFRHLTWGPESFFRVFREKLGWSR